MARKTQQEINYWFQDNTIKSALDLSLIEKVLHINKLDIPNNIIIHKNGSTYDDFAHWYCDEIKISKYPTTYNECCEVLVGRKPNPNEISFDKMELCLVDLDNTQNIDFQNPYLSQLNSLFRLRICRDAYWKIAGEEMGLDKPWEPDWTNLDQLKYCIWVDVGEFITMINVRGQHILAFPTEEMRDTFHTNFKKEIEQCKEFL